MRNQEPRLKELSFRLTVAYRSARNEFILELVRPAYENKGTSNRGFWKGVGAL